MLQIVMPLLGTLLSTKLSNHSDLAAALILHAETHLGAHHSPDLFHVQHDTSRATSVPLHRQTEKAEMTFRKAEASHQQNAKKIADFSGVFFL
jgi:hypothetical protein